MQRGGDEAGNVDRVSVLRGGVITILADTVGYLPFGPMQAMTLGIGITVDRSYDALYRMAGNLSNGTGYDYLWNRLCICGNFIFVTYELMDVPG